MSTSDNNIRRSSRIKAQVQETSDSTPSSRENNISRDSDDRPGCTARYKLELDKELQTIEEYVQKPKELFAVDDVSANRYYGFSSPAKKNVMAKKITLIRSPGKANDPKQSSKVIMLNTTEATSPEQGTPNRTVPATPTFRRTRVLSGLTSSESESVSEDSEFVPSDDEESDGDGDQVSENENDISENEDTKDGKVYHVTKLPNPTTPLVKRGTRKNMIAYSDFHLKTDAYFTSQAAKVLTSNRRLARLKDCRLDEEQLRESVRSLSQLPKLHTQAVHGLRENHRSLFAMWHHIMEEGYSLLLHGLGSKRDLINTFHNEIAINHPTLIVNGFFPSLNVKDILDSIVAELLDLESFSNFDQCFNVIEETLMHNVDDRLYLLIHNIDAEMLRSNKAQDSLSRLAAIPNVRLLASIDHINAPLMWDNVKRSRYNFYWFDASTFLPYKAETSYENSLLVQRSSTLALSSLYNVFQSLTTNAKAIYIILVRHQLENEKNHNYPGMAFKHLYQKAREGFLVSSDLALRAQLIEFIDHKLVRTKRNVDGAEYMIIPLNNALLHQFIDRQDGH